ncbi:MAG: ABC transporter permease [Anaerolineae bacterium]|nr:ABC transporter permease [Anaerolineae bacterium]NUQ06964.1 ABC transporter permease [Anaerolineae bacterium]
MNLWESFRLAVGSILLYPTRAALTMLGIIIGVAAVISLLALGRGVENSVASQFEGLGADILTVRANMPMRGFSSASTPLTLKNLQALADGVTTPSVSGVAAEYQVRATAVDGYNSTSVTVRGVTPNYFTLNEWSLTAGSAFTQSDSDSQAQIAVLGVTVVEDLYGSADYDAVGESLLINDLAFTVVGILAEQTATGPNDPNDAIIVPLLTAQARLGNARVAGEGYQVSSILAKVSDTALLDAAQSEIEAYLLSAHGIADPDQADFTVTQASATAETRTEVLGIVTLFLSGIAAISLLVGGIGVMNIMLVSVSERTREIGLRKAVGARAGDILVQFMIESLLLSMLGGALGVAAGMAIAAIGSQLISATAVLSPEIIVLAVGVSLFIGVFFGVYPANRAARMNPIQALRFE